MTELASKLWYGTFETHSDCTGSQRWYLNTIPVVVKGCGSFASYLWLSQVFKLSPKVHALFFVSVWVGMHLDSYRAGFEKAVFIRLGVGSILAGSCFTAGGHLLNHATNCWEKGLSLRAVGYGAAGVWATLFTTFTMGLILKRKVTTPPRVSWAYA